MSHVNRVVSLYSVAQRNRALLKGSTTDDQNPISRHFFVSALSRNNRCSECDALKIVALIGKTSTTHYECTQSNKSQRYSVKILLLFSMPFGYSKMHIPIAFSFTEVYFMNL